MIHEPMFLPEHLVDHYDQAYWSGQKEYHEHGVTKTYAGPGFAWGGFDAVRDSLWKAIGKPKTLLDACCGGGDFVRRCVASGVEAFGFDGSAYAIEHPSNVDIRPRLRVSDLFKLEIGRRFEVVTAFDALEHFYAHEVTTAIQQLAERSFRWLVFCIGAADHPSHTYFQLPGKPVPPEREGQVVSGHVSIAPFVWWFKTVFEACRAMDLTWVADWQAMTAFQVAMIEDPRAHGPDGRPLQAWGPNRVVILRRSG